MLRRRFLLNNTEENPDFIITYYAPQHIPFAGGYTGILRGYGSNTEYGNENNTVFKCVLDKWSDGVGQYGIKMLNDTHGLWYNQWSSRYSEFLFTDLNFGRLGNYVDIIDNNPKYQTILSSTITDIILPNEIKHLRGTLVSDLLDSFNDSVVNVTLPENLESLDNNVLYSLHSLKNITIPATVNYMGYSTLEISCNKDLSNTLIPDNRSLEEIILKPYNPPQTDTRQQPIGVYDPQHFYINPNLKIRVYADCIDTYKKDAVWGQYSNLYDTINNTIVYYDMDGRQLFEQQNDFTNVSSNSKLNTAISIYLPNSVTSIERSAFSNCSGLTSITIPNSVTSIGESAFFNCSSLTSVTIPNSITSINDYTFYNCSSFTSIVIPDGVTSIGNSAFSDCSSLTSIVIPDSVTSIGDNTFSGCTKLASIVIGNGVKSIGNYVHRSPLRL